MLEAPAEVVEGARILLKILGIGRVSIGIENNKPDAISAMTDAARAASGNGIGSSVSPPCR